MGYTQASRRKSPPSQGGHLTMGRLLAKLPLLCACSLITPSLLTASLNLMLIISVSFSILGGTWLSFMFTIAIPEVLLHRREYWHFAEQFIVFNVLMGLTMLSLFTASNRSPGHPDPLLAPFEYSSEMAASDESGRRLAPRAGPMPTSHDMTQTSKSKSRPPTLSLMHPSANPNSTSGQNPLASLEISPASAVDHDDIPLTFLRNSPWATTRTGKDRPSPLPLRSQRSKLATLQPLLEDEQDSTPSGSGESYSPTTSPFPLALSPFVPNTATDAGEDLDWTDDETGSAEISGKTEAEEMGLRERRKGYWMDGTADGVDDGDVEMSLDRIEAEMDQLLREQSLHTDHGGRKGKALMAKSNTGGPRYCRKCQGWKPDRCHHCRFCKKCVLKMDHHCVWLSTCIGHDKPFLLFITYGTILAIYLTIEGVYQAYKFMTDTGQYGTGSQGSVSESMDADFGPLVYMMLTMSAAFFTLAIGGLASYHWFLVCNNLSTLEQISHTFPSALLPTAPPSSDTSATPPSWKPDHLLTRPERRRLSDEAREINVYDLGWKRNIAQTLIGNTSRERGWARWIRAFWPLSPARNGDGHEFDYDEEKLERLRRLTEELRLGKMRERTSAGSEEGDDEASE